MKIQNLKEKKFLSRQKEAIVCAPGQAASGPSHPLSTPGELSCPAHSALPRGEAAGGPAWCLLPQPSHASLTFPSRWLLSVCAVVLVAPDAQGEDSAPHSGGWSPSVLSPDPTHRSRRRLRSHLLHCFPQFLYPFCKRVSLPLASLPDSCLC